MQLDPQALAVLDKVKKLMALANNNDNEHQAAAASAKAMELLAAYNLDMAMVGKTAKGSQRRHSKLKGGLYGWQRKLWKSVAELNFCMYWSEKGLTKGSTYEHRILGREENVVGAQVMAEYLQGAVERLAREYANTAFPGYSIFIKEMIAYREGLAARLSERLEQLRRDRVEEDERKKREAEAASRHPGNASSGTGLVLADVIQDENDLNNDYLMGYEPGTTSQRRRDAKARQAAATAAYEATMKAEREARDAAELADPSLKEARLAREAKVRAENDEWWEEQAKKQAQREARRAKNPPKVRYRNMTPEEERAAMSTFSAGYTKGNDIGLEAQIDNEKKGRLA